MRQELKKVFVDDERVLDGMEMDEEVVNQCLDQLARVIISLVLDLLRNDANLNGEKYENENEVGHIINTLNMIFNQFKPIITDIFGRILSNNISMYENISIKFGMKYIKQEYSLIDVSRVVCVLVDLWLNELGDFKLTILPMCINFWMNSANPFDNSVLFSASLASALNMDMGETETKRSDREHDNGRLKRNRDDSQARVHGDNDMHGKDISQLGVYMMLRGLLWVISKYPEEVRSLWNWTTFLSFVSIVKSKYQNNDIESLDQLYSQEIEYNIILCYGYIVCGLLKFNNIETKLFFEEELGVLNFPSVEYFCSMGCEFNNLIVDNNEDDKYVTEMSVLLDDIQDLDLNKVFNKSFVIIGNCLLPKREILLDEIDSLSLDYLDINKNEEEFDFVETESILKNMNNISMLLRYGEPIIIRGPNGYGKTKLIWEISKRTGNNNLLEIHLDDQMDARTMLGTYVCTETPGEFVWRSGPLTSAVENGQWILIEDIDKAPFEILASLISLLETRQLYIPGKIDSDITSTISAHPNFRLFGTQSIRRYNSKEENEIFPSISTLGTIRNISSKWSFVTLDSFSGVELKDILMKKFPEISFLIIESLIEYFSEFMPSLKNMNNQSFNNSIDFKSRLPSLRDLIKICNRIMKLNINFDHIKDRTELNAIPDNIRIDISFIIISLLTASMTSNQSIDYLINKASTLWNIESDQIVQRLNEPPVMEIDLKLNKFYIGNINLNINKLNENEKLNEFENNKDFAPTDYHLQILSKISNSIHFNEPILLVGETGCGKTTLVQELASSLNQKLIVQNLSLQTDTADLLGGYKPVEMTQIARPLINEYFDLFGKLFSKSKNAKFIQAIIKIYEQRKWKKLVKSLNKSIQMLYGKLEKKNNENDIEEKEDEMIQKNSKVQKISNIDLFNEIKEFENKIIKFDQQRIAISQSFVFKFSEGTIVQALKNGYWILLDEMNLASSETLQRLTGLFEGKNGSIILTERGDTKPIYRHPNFRVLAAMNPPTDVRKKDLPISLRSRFTEIYVNELMNEKDLNNIVHQYLDILVNIQKEDIPVTKIVKTYLETRYHANETFMDGAFQKPRYSLRTFCRSLISMRKLIKDFGFPMNRAIIESFAMSFGTQLDMNSNRIFNTLLFSQFHLKKKNTKLLVKIRKDEKRRKLRNKVESELSEKELNKLWESFSKQSKNKSFSLSSSSSVIIDDDDVRLPGKQFIFMDGFQIKLGSHTYDIDGNDMNKKFILTKSVKWNLRNLIRAVVSSESPILLQGPTSAGKTSLINYLARKTNHKCVRINNHEHTDVQEYIGTHIISERTGKFIFQDGVLVNALRKGYWVILDELNLAPSEVLEALNRLLDHNRELYIPETQEIVHAHPEFRLFATQNPPGAYGGRKPLSWAFRNRFIELHMDDIPLDELEYILNQKCEISPSASKLLVNCLSDLQQRRNIGDLFGGKNSFISPRDLFRWATRHNKRDENISSFWKQELAEEGYMLLGEKIHKDEYKYELKNVIEKIFGKSIDINESIIYKYNENINEIEVEEEKLNRKDITNTSLGSIEDLVQIQDQIEQINKQNNIKNIPEGCEGITTLALTNSIKRLYRLVSRCIQNEEPVLLVGDTGCGKTTICQLFSLYFNIPLNIINCHQNTETSDILGSLRPIRSKDDILNECNQLCYKLYQYMSEEIEMNINDINDNFIIKLMEELHENQDLNDLNYNIDEKYEFILYFSRIYPLDEFIKLTVEQFHSLKRRYDALFEWFDGPLIKAMKNGEFLLLDEISLAEDAVIERLNSVLEPGRSLLLAEKNSNNDMEEIIAHPNFRIFATMNPGGDFGKRELSPALRSRFTEIWVPAVVDRSDIKSILEKTINQRNDNDTINLSFLVNPMLDFADWFNNINSVNKSNKKKNKRQSQPQFGLGLQFSIRDILSWAKFINEMVMIRYSKNNGDNNIEEIGWSAYLNGAALVMLDGLGLGTAISQYDVIRLRKYAIRELLNQIINNDINEKLKNLINEDYNETNLNEINFDENKKLFSINNFSINLGSNPIHYSSVNFQLSAPTTFINLKRILRAMQIKKPILLEGSPGVGKTSLITALAKTTGNNLIRINLSEQTELSDLLGSDLPVSETDNNNNKPNFAWFDGIFLRALKRGDWVLLDELNLAPQSVLEGLNACFDHREEVFIPEIGKTFHCPSTFRVFAAQNPLSQGGGRKGLPKSFLNRFTKVYVTSLRDNDLFYITKSKFNDLNTTVYDPNYKQQEDDETLLEKMINLNNVINDKIEKGVLGRIGSPWEFNLRDIFRWCELIIKYHNKMRFVNTLNTVYNSFYLTAILFYNVLYVQRMRTEQDRILMISYLKEYFFDSSFFEIFPVILFNNDSLLIDSILLNNDNMINSNESFNLSGLDKKLLSNYFPKTLNDYFLSLSIGIDMKWPSLLIGGNCTGKTLLLRHLASIHNNILIEIPITSSTDVAEMIGCFEQTDSAKYNVLLDQHLENISLNILKQLIMLNYDNGQINNFAHCYFLYNNLKHNNNDKDNEIIRNELFSLIQNVIENILTTDKYSLLSQTYEELKIIYKKWLSQLSNHETRGKFEWIDGPLVKALEFGYWVVLDNVNYCTSSVLDRLNALLEPNGYLLLGECCDHLGEPRKVYPHPNFRFFATMDPEKGEISRAMRNRCLELNLMTKGLEKTENEVIFNEDDSLILNENNLIISEYQYNLRLCKQYDFDLINLISKHQIYDSNTINLLILIHGKSNELANKFGEYLFGSKYLNKWCKYINYFCYYNNRDRMITKDHLVYTFQLAYSFGNISILNSIFKDIEQSIFVLNQSSHLVVSDVYFNFQKNENMVIESLKLFCLIHFNNYNEKNKIWNSLFSFENDSVDKVMIKEYMVNKFPFNNIDFDQSSIICFLKQLPFYCFNDNKSIISILYFMKRIIGNEILITDIWNIIQNIKSHQIFQNVLKLSNKMNLKNHVIKDFLALDLFQKVHILKQLEDIENIELFIIMSQYLHITVFNRCNIIINERNVINDMNASQFNSITTLSWFSKSYLVYNEIISKKRINLEISYEFYPLCYELDLVLMELSNFQKYEDILLNLGIKFFNGLKDILSTRDNLSIFLQNEYNSFSWDYFFTIWKQFSITYQNFYDQITLILNSTVLENLNVIVHNIEGCIEKEWQSIYQNDQLWENIGHPLPPSSKNNFDVLLKLIDNYEQFNYPNREMIYSKNNNEMKLSFNFNDYIYSNHSSIYLNTNHKLAIVEGISLLFFMERENQHSNNDDLNFSEMLEKLNTSFIKEKENYDDLLKQNQIVNYENDDELQWNIRLDDEKMLKSIALTTFIQEEIFETDTLTKKWGDIQLSQTISQLLLRKEYKILNKLTYLLNFKLNLIKIMNGDERSLINDIVDNINLILDYGLKYSSISIQNLSCYQILKWLFEDFNNDNLKKINILKEIICILSSQFRSMLWSVNLFSDMNIISNDITIDKVDDSSTKKQIVNKYEKIFMNSIFAKLSKGTIRLQQPSSLYHLIRLYGSFFYLNNLETNVNLVSISQPFSFIRKEFVSKLSLNMSDIRLKQGYEHLNHLNILYKESDDIKHNKLQELKNNLLVIIYIFKQSWLDEEEFNIHFDQLQSNNKFDENKLNDIKSFLNRTNDNRFKALIQTVFMPVISIIYSDIILEDGMNKYYLMFGCILFELGKYLLLLPSQPVDPGLRPGIEANILSMTISNMTTNLIFNILNDFTKCGKINLNSDNNKEFDVKLNHLMKRKQEYLRKKLVRPETTLEFADLFRDIYQFSSTIFTPKRIMNLSINLLMKILSIYNVDHNYFKNYVYIYELIDNHLNNNEINDNFNFEETFQSTISSFLYRIEHKYKEYLDIIYPLYNSIDYLRSMIRELNYYDQFHQIYSINSIQHNHPIIELFQYLCNFPTLSILKGSELDQINNLETFASQLKYSLRPWMNNTDGKKNRKIEKDDDYYVNNYIRIFFTSLYQTILLKSEYSLTFDKLNITNILNIIDVYMNAWKKEKKEREEKEREANAFIQYKKQTHEIQSMDEKNEELYRKYFPDFIKDYADILIDDQDAILASKSAEILKSNNLKENENDNMIDMNDLSIIKGPFNDKQIHILCGIHSRIFLRSNKYIHSHTETRLLKSRLKNRLRKIQNYNAIYLLNDKSFKYELLDSSFSSLFTLSPILNHLYNMNELNVDMEKEMFSIFCLEFSNHFKQFEVGKSKWIENINEKSKNFNQNKCISPIISFNSYSNKNIEMKNDLHNIHKETSELSIILSPFGRDSTGLDDFQRESHTSKARSIDNILKPLLKRITELLSKFPGHAILIQIAKIIDRIRYFEIQSSPRKILTGIELLYRKVQEWEQYASKDVSLNDKLQPISNLIADWRKIELNSWKELFNIKEIEFCIYGQRWYFHLYSLLNKDKNLLNSNRNKIESSYKKITKLWKKYKKHKSFNTKWYEQIGFEYIWIWNSFLKNNNDEEEKIEEELNQEYLNIFNELKLKFKTIVDVIDGFLRKSNMGEYPTRISLLSIFIGQIYSELDEDMNNLCSYFNKNHNPKSNKLRLYLGRILYNIWRYHFQYLYTTINIKQKRRIPIEKKLKEEVKLAKWDQQTYYSLQESSEKSHKKLMKYLREFDDLLASPISQIMEKDMRRGIGDLGDINSEPEMVDSVPTMNELFPLASINDDDKSINKWSVHYNKNEELLNENDFIYIKLLNDQTQNYVYKYSTFIKKLNEYLNKFISFDNNDCKFGSASSYGIKLTSIITNTIFQRIKSLQTNKSSKQMKRMAIKDLFKGLKDQGIQYIKSVIPIFGRDMFNMLCLPSPFSYASIKQIKVDEKENHTFNSIHFQPFIWKKADYYFQRNIAELSQMKKELTGIISPDINRNDANIMLGFSNHLKFFSYQQKAIIYCFSNNLISFYDIKENFNSFRSSINSNSCNFVLLDEKRYNRLKLFYQSLIQSLECIDEFRMFRESISNLNENNNNSLIDYENNLLLLDECYEKTKEILNDFPLPQNNLGILSYNQFMKLKDLTNDFEMNVLNKLKIINEDLSQFTISLNIDKYCESMKQKIKLFEILINELEILFENNIDLNTDELFNQNLSLKLSHIMTRSLVMIEDLYKFRKQMKNYNDSDSNDKTADEIDDDIDDIGYRYKLNAIQEMLFNELNKLQIQLYIKKNNQFLDWIRNYIFDMDQKSFQSINFTLLMKQYYEYILIINTLLENILKELITYHASFNKMNYLILRIFRTLLSKGICSANSGDDEEEGEDDNDLSGMTFEDDVEGTGMGEGEGKKDVSDQIEDENQLLGLQGENEENDDQQESGERKTLNEKEKETGMDMEEDFEGEIYDEEQNEDDDDNDDDLDEDDPEEREMDEKQEFDDKSEVIDEKLWDSEDEDDEDEQANQQEEKFEKDSKVKGEALDDETHTKDDEDDTTKDEKNDEENEDIRTENKKDEKDENEMDEDQINEDDSDNYEDQHLGIDVRDERENNEDDLDLPEDLELDQNENDNDDDEGENDDDDDGDHDINSDEDNDGIEEDENESNMENENNDKNNDDNMDIEEEEVMDNSLVNNFQQNEDEMDLENENNEENNEDENNEDEKNEDIEEENSNQQNEEKDKQIDYGTEDKEGIDQIKVENKTMDNTEESDESNEKDKETKQNSEENEETEEQEENDNEMTKASHGLNGLDESKEMKSGVSNNTDNNDNEDDNINDNKSNEEIDENQKPNCPNPWKNPGDALKHWHRRLDIMETKNNEKEEEEESSKLQNEEDENKVKEENNDEEIYDKNQKYEYMKENERDQTEVQVLGAVEDEVDMNIKENEENNINDDDDNDEDIVQNDEIRLDDDNGNTEENDKNELDKSVESSDEIKDKDSKRKEERKDEIKMKDIIDTIEDHKEQIIPEYDMELDDENEVDLKRDHELVTQYDFFNNEEEQKEEKKHIFDPSLLIEELNKSNENDINNSVLSYEKGRKRWQKLRAITLPLSQRLCEQLRLVLAPMLATKLQGDYRTGKRINMKRIIPYIASGFRKDKIWLRRTKPAQRSYHIMLAIDDSLSMRESGKVALASLVMIQNALTQLEVGNVGVIRFGESVETLHELGSHLNDEKGAKILSSFQFNQKKTKIIEALNRIEYEMEESRHISSMNSSIMDQQVFQIVFLISDGKFDNSSRNNLKRLIRDLTEKQILLVLIIIDQKDDESILKLETIDFLPNGQVKRQQYLEDYPFPFYMIIEEVESLPEILADALRQWFELIQSIN